MWEKVDDYVRKYDLLREGDAILVGLSGGADSVCLLRYLLAVRERMPVRLFAVHVNHMLREEEADRDEKFARDLCARYQVPFAAVRKDVAAERKRRRCSLEEAGRLVRYACFGELAEQWGCNKIAVAHHKNDLAETVLFRLARGTGVRGLSGIRPISGPVIRPLLCLEREEIREILLALGQDHVEDSSNSDDGYSRNYIRRHLLPGMKEVNTRAVEHLAQTAGQAAALMDYLEPVFCRLYTENVQQRPEGLLLPERAADRMHPVERRELLQRMLAAAGGQRDLSAVHLEQADGLFEKREGKYLTLPGGLRAVRTEEGVLICRLPLHLRGQTGGHEDPDVSRLPEGEAEGLPLHLQKEAGRGKPAAEPAAVYPVDMEALARTGSYVVEIAGRGRVTFHLEEFHGGDIEKNDCVKYFDYDRIKSTLCLRSRQSGDYFIVDREGRHKTLRRYFIDEKIPAGERERKIVLAEGAHILWIPGGRISEAYKVGPETGRVLVVRAEDNIWKSNIVE